MKDEYVLKRERSRETSFQGNSKRRNSPVHNRESIKARLTCCFRRYTMRFGCRRYDRRRSAADS